MTLQRVESPVTINIVGIPKMELGNYTILELVDSSVTFGKLKALGSFGK